MIASMLKCKVTLILRRLEIILLFIFFVNGLIAQNPVDFIERVQNYQKAVKIKHTGKFPDSIDTLTFNLNRYLQCFDKLIFPDGLRCYYIFADDKLGGSPILYFKIDSLEINTYIEKKFQESVDQNNIDKSKITKEFVDVRKHQILCGFAANNNARNYIKPEDTEIGYMQYLFFNQFGEQFALKWHSNYGQKSVIFSKKEMKRLYGYYSNSADFTCSMEDFEKLLRIKPTPIIEMRKDKCVITWYEIRTHTGIHRMTYEISRLSPFTIKTMEDIELLKINMEFIY